MERKLKRQIYDFVKRFSFAWMCARTCSPLHVDYIVTLMALENGGLDGRTICDCCFVNRSGRPKETSEKGGIYNDRI